MTYYEIFSRHTAKENMQQIDYSPLSRHCSCLLPDFICVSGRHIRMYDLWAFKNQVQCRVRLLCRNAIAIFLERKFIFNKYTEEKNLF